MNCVEFSRGIHGLGISASEEELSELFNFISKDKKLNQSLFELALKTFKSLNIVSYSDLKGPVDHLYLRLQIQRMTFENFILLFPEENITFNDLFTILSTDLYRLDQEMANTITKYIFGNSSKTTRDQIKEKLSNILGE